MKIQEIFNLILESKISSHSGAGIIFFNGHNVLMLKDNNNKWAFPGGKPVEGETPIETAKRETKEEVGLFAGKIMDKIKFTNDSRVFYSFFSKVNKNFNVTLSDEHTDYTWINYKNIKKLPLRRFVRKNLKYIIDKLDKLNSGKTIKTS